MTKQELFQPSSYIAMPKRLAADRKLTAAAKVTWAVIAERLGENEDVWAGMGRIAKDAGVSRRAVIKILDHLEKAGWLKRHRQGYKPNSKEKESNHYELTIPPSEQTSLGSEQSALGSEQNSLGVVNRVHYPSEQNSLGGSEQSAQELPHLQQPKLTTTYKQEESASPPGASPHAAPPLPASRPVPVAGELIAVNGDLQRNDDMGPQASGIQAKGTQGGDSSLPAVVDMGPKANTVGAEGNGSSGESFSTANNTLEPEAQHRAGGQRRSGSLNASKSSKRSAGHNATRPATLSDTQKIQICASAKSMANWLRWGSAAIDQAPAADTALQPTSTHWHIQTPANQSSIDPDATPAQLAGAGWFAISFARQQRAQPITMPNMGRLIKAMDALKQTRTTQQITHMFGATVREWEKIQTSLAWMSPPPGLDEGVFQNPKIIAAIEAILSGASSSTPQRTNTGPAPGYEVADRTPAKRTKEQIEEHNRLCIQNGWTDQILKLEPEVQNV